MPRTASLYLLLGLRINDWVQSKISFPVCHNSLPQTAVLASQETDIHIVRACHATRQPLQNHPSGHHEGRETPRSAEEMLDGQHQRVDIPAHARIAHRKRLEEALC